VSLQYLSSEMLSSKIGSWLASFLDSLGIMSVDVTFWGSLVISPMFPVPSLDGWNADLNSFGWFKAVRRRCVF